MKSMNFMWSAIIITSFLLIAGCNNDDDKDVSDFVGNFVISKAELAAVLVIPTVESGNFSIPVATNITQVIQTALLSAVSCSSASKSYVELRENFSMYFSCEGANPLNTGTWEEVSATSLKLNMNSTAIPPVGFVLTVTDIEKDATGLTGIATVPLPKIMVANMVAAMQKTIDPSAAAVYMATISIEFTKK
jgi:hypothetical protein